ncbi:helicase-related protein [Streptomyces sp. NRRL F-5635]|uniref:helicase-related protein n=1 Tax=Streptomyces sp. NRRL F-5635 TaxID=1463865 RepID=UPI000A75B9D4|nr:helicase-related protein [Streptomyces sp. NRRL F-5635]
MSPPQLFFAHGEHTPAQRADTFTAFAAADCTILANSRRIAEGVDIPSVDAIVFADPTRSVIRCVQPSAAPCARTCPARRPL